MILLSNGTHIADPPHGLSYYVGLPRNSQYPLYDGIGNMVAVVLDSGEADLICNLINNDQKYDTFDIDSKDAEIDELEGQVTDLETQLTLLQREYDKLEVDNEALEEKVAGLEKIIERARNGNLFPGSNFN